MVLRAPPGYDTLTSRITSPLFYSAPELAQRKPRLLARLSKWYAPRPAKRTSRALQSQSPLRTTRSAPACSLDAAKRNPGKTHSTPGFHFIPSGLPNCSLAILSPGISPARPAHASLAGFQSSEKQSPEYQRSESTHGRSTTRKPIPSPRLSGRILPR